MRLSSFAWACGCLLVGAAGAAACGGNEAQGPKAPSGGRSTVIEHEPCDEGGRKVVALPGIRYVYDKSTGKELCRVADINQNGKPDIYQYFDANGLVRRREADYDEDGVVDAIEYYENGKLVRHDLDIASQHRFDTWDTYDPATGKRVKRERDNDGDGRVDQWWTWDGDKVTIAFDKNNDGQPDPNGTITLDAAGAAILTSAIADAGAGDAGPPPSTASTLGSGVDAGLGSVTPSTVDADILRADAGAAIKPVNPAGGAK